MLQKLKKKLIQTFPKIKIHNIAGFYNNMIKLIFNALKFKKMAF